jgi:hypothetical protein
MSAGETIEGLIKVGMTIKDTWIKSKKADGGLDWKEFLQSDAVKDTLSKSKGLLAKLSKNDIQKALDAVREKQKALLGGKSIMDLPTEKLGQYDALLDVEAQLTHKFAKSTGNREWVNWLVGEALPVLVKVGKVVIPILL